MIEMKRDDQKLLGFLKWIRNNCIRKATFSGLGYYCLSEDEVEIRIRDIQGPSPHFHLWVKLPGKAAERIHSYWKDQLDLAIIHARNYNRCYPGQGAGPCGEVAWIDFPIGRYWP